MTDRALRLLAAAGWLPAGFWLVYAVWNTVLPAPPAFGPFTVINVFYLAMLPAALVSVVRWRQCGWPGRMPYGLFLGWAVVGLAWYDPAYDIEVAKQILIYALLGLTAAQIVVGTRSGAAAFTASLLVVSLGLSIWTIGHALTSGFSYRGGLPVNPNLPATLIGPGLLAALALSLRRERTRMAPAIMAVLLASLYACLILGSRGVLAALLGAIALVIWRVRPTIRRSLTVGVAAVVVVVVAQVPAIPYAIWTRVVTFASIDQPAGPAGPSPGDVRSGGQVAGGPDKGPGTASPPVVPLAANAAESTAFARLREEGVGTFNLRRDLWGACVRYLVSGPGPLLAGGGMGKSEAIAHATNPVFRDSHHAWLQMVVDFGLLGLLLLVWSQWRIVQSLLGRHGWRADLGLAVIVFWTIAGLTATVTDLHVYWVSIGASAGLAAQPAWLAGRPSPAETRSPLT